MKNVVFTICAKNYIGLSLVLKESYLTNNSNNHFFIFVADENDTSIEMPENTLVAKDILGYPEDKWKSMAFKYNLTEFCTAIKPDCFKWLFANFPDVEKVCYLDPDILIFNSFENIWELLNSYKIVVTPHLCTIESVYSGDKPEDEILYAGQFNLGFIAVRRSPIVDQMMCWWANRLVDFCYGDRSTNLCYDQKWIDSLVSYIDRKDLYVLRDLGYNMAPWNFYEREFVCKEGKCYVRSRINGGGVSKLVFVHYSGYNYKELMKHQVLQGNIASMKSYSDIAKLLCIYGDVLKNNENIINQYIDNKYTYGYYEDGKPIDIFHRQLYRGLGKEQADYGNPFDVHSAYYKMLKRRKLLVDKLGTNVNKIGKNDIDLAMQRKLHFINYISIQIFKILGLTKYKMLLRLLSYYGQSKYHIHLLTKKYISTNLKM